MNFFVKANSELICLLRSSDFHKNISLVISTVQKYFMDRILPEIVLAKCKSYSNHLDIFENINSLCIMNRVHYLENLRIQNHKFNNHGLQHIYLKRQIIETNKYGAIEKIKYIEHSFSVYVSEKINHSWFIYVGIIYHSLFSYKQGN